MDDYIRLVHKTTEFFSTSEAAYLFDLLEQFALDGGYTVSLSKDKYKAKLRIPVSED